MKKSIETTRTESIEPNSEFGKSADDYQYVSSITLMNMTECDADYLVSEADDRASSITRMLQK